jgi:fluoride exporter
MTLLLVVAGAFVGAPARYLTDRWVQRRHDSRLPWGTITVNVVGSAVLGALLGGLSTTGGPSWLQSLLGTGFCGALTTFSTFSFETVRLLEDGEGVAASVNVLVSVLAGAAAFVAAYAAAAALVLR